MISPKAIRFARAMALVSQALPIPAALATGAAIAACEDKPAEQPMGVVAAPERTPPPTADASAGSNMFPEGAVGTVAAPQKPTEHKVGLEAAPDEPTVGTVAAPEHKVGKMAAPEPPVGKRVAPDAGAKH